MGETTRLAPPVGGAGPLRRLAEHGPDNPTEGAHVTEQTTPKTTGAAIRAGLNKPTQWGGK